MNKITDRLEAVFSAHAEVVPGKSVQTAVWFGILRARGGSSSSGGGYVGGRTYSPRTRR